jgi:hypothetical protein
VRGCVGARIGVAMGNNATDIHTEDKTLAVAIMRNRQMS